MGAGVVTTRAAEPRTETTFAAAGASVWGFTVATFAESRWAEGGTRAALATGLGEGAGVVTSRAAEPWTETTLAATGASVWGFAVATFTESRRAGGGTRAALAVRFGVRGLTAFASGFALRRFAALAVRAAGLALGRGAGLAETGSNLGRERPWEGGGGGAKTSAGSSGSDVGPGVRRLAVMIEPSGPGEVGTTLVPLAVMSVTVLDASVVVMLSFSVRRTFAFFGGKGSCEDER